MQSDDPICSAPRIGEATFAAVLGGAQSPAAPEAADCYTAIVSFGVDPALALAQFAHESFYGRLGIARTTKSWGNIRRNGAFVAYDSWAAGARDYAALISGPLYARDPGYDTARTMPYRWAPASDGNDPAAYGADLVARINALIALDHASQEAHPVLPQTPTVQDNAQLRAAQQNLIYAEHEVLASAPAAATQAYLAKAFDQIEAGAASASAPPADPATGAAPARAPLTPVPAPSFPPPNPPAPVIPALLDAFVANNPDLDPTEARSIAQILGQSGVSAQTLAVLRVRKSSAVQGLIVTADTQELPIFETGDITDGTVLCNGFPSMPIYIQGAYSSPDQGAGHVTTVIAEMFTSSGVPVPVTAITPGSDGFDWIGGPGTRIDG